ncbi:hypothetical protein L6164_005979 [Bauhinia variegata]|uniref:Uncharacterized protein n=1 Tax=Bauhinia variegata TaxID=167791 RepID=A0ACB9PT22_BAUVA|nr:hypothetical protein L6164_005979 [Bauhinia variegata]
MSIPLQSKFHSNWVLNDLSKSGRINEARQVFDYMLERDQYTHNTMIAAYANSGRLVEARGLFDELEKTQSVHFRKYSKGVFCPGSDPKWEQIHGYVVKTGFESNVFVVTVLVDMYAKCKCISEAEYLFKILSIKDNHVLWTAMVTGYTQNGGGLKAIKVFRDMRAEGVDCNQFTFPSISTACSAVSAHCFGDQVHGCLVQSGFGTTIYVQRPLVVMYAKCGDLNSARRILETIEVDDVVSLVGCVRHGLEEEALLLFKKMHVRDMKIDDHTFPSVLNCCIAGCMDVKSSHCLIIKTGFENHRTVGNALIDAYAKTGNLNCAYLVFNQMLEKDIISWTSLVTGYACHGFYEESLKMLWHESSRNFIKSGLRSSLSVENSLVTMYAKCLFELEPSNAMPYVLLFNMYFAAIRWYDAAKIRKLMKSKGIFKQPGCSWIEINSRMHTFMSYVIRLFA